jgi:hypothetical protein
LLWNLQVNVVTLLVGCAPYDNGGSGMVGYTVQNLPVLTSQTRRRSKGPTRLIKTKLESVTTRNRRVRWTNRVATFAYRFHTNIRNAWMPLEYCLTVSSLLIHMVNKL